MSSYIFGGNTGMSYEEVQRQRKLAQALLGRAGQGGIRTPADGITAIGNVIAGGIRNYRADKHERKGREGATKAYEELLAAMGGGSGAAGAATAPAPATGAPAPSAGSGGGQDAIIDAIIKAESGGNAGAVSPKGATGLMQVMPDTARDPGYGMPSMFEMARQAGRNVPDESADTLQALLRDPEINRQFGTAYYQKMLEAQGGDQERALAAYNAGPGAVQQHGGVPPYPETQQYIQNVQRNLARGGGAQGGGQPAPAPQQPGAQPAPQPGQSGPSLQQLAQLAGNGFLNDGQRSVVQALLQQRMQGPETMTPYQQAQIAMRQREMEMRQAGTWSPGTNVTVNNQGDNAWAKESAKLFAKRYDDITTQAGSAHDMLSLYDAAEGAMNSGVRTGSFGSGEQEVRKLGLALGIGDAETVGAGELLSSIQNRMALMMRNPDSGMGMPGATSDRDLTFLKESQIGIDRTPEGNRRMLKVLRRMERRKIEISELADKYVQDNGRLDAGFNRSVREYAEANPMFADMMRGEPGADGPQRERAGTPAGPQPGHVEQGYRFKGGDPADPNNWERI